MKDKQTAARLRQIFSKPVWALLLYYGIMNAAVTAVMALEIAVGLLLGPGDREAAIDRVVERAAANGWGYLLAMAVGAVALLLWKKREFCLVTIWQREKKMTAGAFFALMALFFSIQSVAQGLTLLTEWLAGLFGLSILDSLEQISGAGDTVSMFLYASVFAPIGEEILFRGLLQRSFAPYGKKFSILASAFLFGMFHGNFIQTPYAFLIGLVLGYVTAEYSILWAILLHMLNNMVLADFMTRLSEILPPGVGDLITLVFIWGCTAAAVVVLLCRRRAVKAYLTEKRLHPLCLRAFFTCPGTVVFTGFMAANILLTLLLQLFA